MGTYFSTSGIRGIFGEKITVELARKLAGSLITLGYRTVVIGMDVRLSGPVLEAELTNMLRRGGCAVYRVGVVPTPVLSHATRRIARENTLEKGDILGIMITASHNPPQYNGFKLVDAEGCAFTPDMEDKVEEHLELAEATYRGKEGVFASVDALNPYLDDLKECITLNTSVKVLADPGNGAAYKALPSLLNLLNQDCISINDTSDGNFPNRMPEPNEKNLGDTAKQVVKQDAQIGFCQDGDADRMIPIDETGKVVDFDKFLVFLSKHMMRETGKQVIVTTVDASMALESTLPDASIIRTRVGDVFVAAALRDNCGAFGGEPSGSFIFPEWGLWPDGLYAAVKTLQFLEHEGKPLSVILNEMPAIHMKREKFHCPEKLKENVMVRLKKLSPEDAKLITVDGLRIEFDDSAVLIRPSGTEPYLRLNVESEDRDILDLQLAQWTTHIMNEIQLGSDTYD